MSLVDRISASRRSGRKAFVEPAFWDQEQFRFPFSVGSTATQERIETDFEGYVNGAYKSNGVVFSAIDRRQQVFSQAQFRFRRYRGGQPGELFGNMELSLIENPWPNGTTGQLLALMEYDGSLAGSFYGTTVDTAGRLGRTATADGKRIARMRPDWTTLIIDAPSGDPYGLDARVVAFSYKPLSGGNAQEPVILLPEEVCHYVPKPDPMARFRGMSWLTPVIREVMADKAAVQHKLKFFENGATPNMALKFDKDVAPEQFNAFVEKFNSSHRGSANAYKTLFLANGADPVPLAMDFKQMDFKLTIGAGETRLAVASGVPAVILGISEGLAGSSLNAGNFSAARRLFVDTTIRDLWSKATPALASLIKTPSDAKLEVVDRDIPFLREDAKDDAEIRGLDARALRQLVDAGFHPDAAVQYIRTGDLSLLTGQHSGLFSVQLQPAGTPMPGASDGSAQDTTNGRTNGAQASLLR